MVLNSERIRLEIVYISCKINVCVCATDGMRNVSGINLKFSPYAQIKCNCIIILSYIICNQIGKLNNK